MTADDLLRMDDGHTHRWGARLVHVLNRNVYLRMSGAFCLICGLEDYTRVPDVEGGLVSSTTRTLP